ncbi:MAG: cysteine synthase A [Deltaproteobacteria bacterium]|nr:cysteine synthase A [Deltaproteobacteria bacterium]MCB9479840.1 cysteine synthase A [Deltaproteobacteria bacterium]MCB9489482.1 cysteine synthase A [Deltaproteobacteria bacterium]
MEAYEARELKAVAQTNIADDMCQLVGNTPLLRLGRFGEGLPGEIVGKLESHNPGASVKDRIALAMIESAEAEGKIEPGKTIIVEATSGNTGIGLAWVASVKGYKIILCMPKSMSIERRKLLMALGAELVLTDADEGMEGAIDQAKLLIESLPNAWCPEQFNNPANPEMHRRTTAEEIWRDAGGKVDIFVAGVGTGGTLTGAGSRLKELNPDIKVVAVEPETSAVLSGGEGGPHMIQGIGAGFIPKVYNADIVDEVMTVSNDEAMSASRQLATSEGLLCGISAGAAAAVAFKLAARPENKGKRIVFIVPDTGERYLSTHLYFDY